MLIRNSGRCLVCGEIIDKEELICEVCKDMESLDLVKLICRTEIVLPENFEVISIFKDRVIFAKNINSKAVHPYVVWSIGYMGDVYGGNYFSDMKTARAFYFNRLLNMV